MGRERFLVKQSLLIFVVRVFNNHFWINNMQEYQIFISYKRNPDATVAEQIYNELESRGYLTFLDRTGLEGGSRFPERIISAIQSSKLFILLLSNATRKSDWVKKEIDIAIKKAKKNELIIVPVICDGTHQTEFAAFLPKYLINTFNFIETDGDISTLCRQLFNILEGHSIYPPKEVADFLTNYKETKNAVESIPNDIRELVTECMNCPRKNSEDIFIQCPRFHPSRKPDDLYFEEERENAIARYKAKNPQPLREQFASEFDYDEAYDKWAAVLYWIEDRYSDRWPHSKSIKQELIEQVEEKHLTWGNRTICNYQVNKINSVLDKIRYLNRPLFQSDLVFFEKDINDIKRSFNDESWRILDTLCLNGLLSFMLIQVARAWEVKKDMLNYLVIKESHGSIKNLLSYHFDAASKTILRAIESGNQICASDYYSFFLLWFLLRKNSCYLTQSLIRKDIETDDKLLISSIEGFMEAYGMLSNSEKSITFATALSYPFYDLPEESWGSGANMIGYNLSDYDWLYLEENVYEVRNFRVGEEDLVKEESYTWISKIPRNSYHNPLSLENLSSADGVLYGFSRGSYSGPLFTLSHYDYSDGYNDIIYDIVAIDHLYSLYYCCKELKEFLIKDSRITEVFIDVPLLKYKLFKDLDRPFSTINSQAYEAYYTNYDALVYSEISPIFIDALSEINNGNITKGKELLELLSDKNDLNAIVYLANIYAYDAQPDYLKALSLYEKAVSRGVRSCIFNVAQCYELLHNYRLAYWWYLLLLDDGTTDQENLNLRLGNCCFHMDERCDHYFEKAGDKGQAAIYLLFDAYYDYEKDEQLSKAIAAIIKVVRPRLCDFSDLDRNMLEEKALEGDFETQFLIGLREVRQYMSSDEFIDKALSYIKNAAINNNPFALCFLGLFMKQLKNDSRAGDAYLEKALRAFYPDPFPDLSRME